MSVIPLFIVITACVVGDVVIKNTFARGEVCTAGDNHVFNAIACVIGAPLALLIYGLSPFSLQSVLLGLCCGFCMGFVAIYGVKSFQTGPVSLTSMFGCFSMLIPILAGFIIWREPVTMMKVFGIFLMFLSVYFIISPSADGQVTREWIRNVFIYAISTGLMSLFQQIAAKTAPQEASSFLFVTYVSSCLFICMNLPYLQKRPELAVTKKFFSKENLNGLLVGILGAISTICSIKALGLMDSTVFYPLKVGISLICNALVSSFLFHDRLSRKQSIGFLIGMASILILTIWS